MSADRLRGPDLDRPFYAVRSTTPVSTIAELCAAYRTRMREGDAFSHGTAAMLWGMPLPQNFGDRRIHVTSPAASRAVRGRGVVGHSQQLRTGDTRVLHEHRVMSPTATWVQLSTMLPWWELVALGDFIITGLPFESLLPLATLDDLRGTHRQASSSRGARARTLALAHLREGAFSRPESLCRLLFQLAGLPEPLINHEIIDSRGSMIALPDLLWPDFRLAFEYEGEFHREKRRYRRDVLRVERIVDEGWRVVKATANDLFDRPGELVARVARRLTVGGWTGSPHELPQIGPFRR